MKSCRLVFGFRSDIFEFGNHHDWYLPAIKGRFTSLFSRLRRPQARSLLCTPGAVGIINDATDPVLFHFNRC